MNAKPDHWLLRLSPDAWLAAAHNELRLAKEQERSRRKSITHARRAAGMALNAVLVAQVRRGADTDEVEAIWGRSYIDHLRQVARAGSELFGGGAGLRDDCAALMSVPVVPPQGLVALSRPAAGPSASALTRARSIVTQASAMTTDI